LYSFRYFVLFIFLNEVRSSTITRIIFIRKREKKELNDVLDYLQTLRAHLDNGKKLPFPDGILINGRGPNGASFNVEQGTLINP